MNDYIFISILVILSPVLIVASSLLAVGVGLSFILRCMGIIMFIYAFWLIAKLFGDIAKAKGHDESGMVLFIFLTSFIGYIYVLALPDESQKPNENSTDDNQSE